MVLEKQYSPNVAIPPGKTLAGILEEIGMSQIELAKRTGLASKTINEIIKAKNPITPDTAIKLSSVFGMSASFWNNLERNYQATLLRLREIERLSIEFSDFKKFSCYKELEQWRYVKKVTATSQKVVNLLNFFGVSSLALIPDVQYVAFKKSDNKKLNKESLAAWLRCGELDAQEIDTKKFDKDKLFSSIGDLRLLTMEGPSTFQEKLIQICSSFGVAVTFVPYFKNTYVNGATRWISSEKALLQLSLKGKYDDIFWFTFFHELAHLLKHGKKEQFIEFESKKGENLAEKEKQANEFAANILIPEKEYIEFVESGNFSDHAIKSFAFRLKISPHIVAGRLSHERGNWKRWAHLRRKLDFVADGVGHEDRS